MHGTGRGLNRQVEQGTGDTNWAITETGKHGKQNQKTTGLNTGSVLFKNKTRNTEYNTDPDNYIKHKKTSIMA